MFESDLTRHFIREHSSALFQLSPCMKSLRHDLEHMYVDRDLQILVKVSMGDGSNVNYLITIWYRFRTGWLIRNETSPYPDHERVSTRRDRYMNNCTGIGNYRFFSFAAGLGGSWSPPEVIIILDRSMAIVPSWLGVMGYNVVCSLFNWQPKLNDNLRRLTLLIAVIFLVSIYR